MGVGQGNSILDHLWVKINNFTCFVLVMGLSKINPFQTHPKTEVIGDRNQKNRDKPWGFVLRKG